ncbi:hypothetical protein BJ742DRAFT_221896 [Cladochytrium replicatum]|nr:hypothetical protein BJ742DRAFT_221896 [Cladochytrium replicatum]
MKSLLTFFGFVAFYGNRMYAPARLCPSGTGAQTGFCSLAKRQSTKASNDHQQAAPNYDMNIYMALEQGMESFFSLVQDSDYQLMLDHDKPNMLPPVPTSASPSAKRRSDATDDSPRKKSKTDGTEISENVENNAEIPSSVWTTLDDEESQETPEAALERQAAIQSRARHLRNVFERVVPMFPSNPRANEKGKQPAMGFAYSPSLGAPTPSESPDRDGTGATPDDVQKKVGFHLQGLHLPGGLSVAVSDAGLQAAAAAAAQAGISLPPQLPILAALQEAATHVQFAQSPALLAQVAELQQQQHQQQHAQIDGSAADNANVAHSNDSDDESGDEFGRLSPNSQRDVRFQNRPRKKRQNWTSEEDTALQRGLVQFGHGQWTTIKAEYPELHHRTLGQIRERVKLLMKKHVVVMKHGRDNHDDHDDDGSDDEDSENVYPDAAVAMPLPPDHDHAAASQQDPEDKKKPKTEAKAQRGKSVEVIIQDPPPSSSKPRKMREFWTSEEDAALIAGVKRFGLGRWAQIKTLYAMELQRRGAVQIKDRWRNLTKNGFDPLAA